MTSNGASRYCKQATPRYLSHHWWPPNVAMGSTQTDTAAGECEVCAPTFSPDDARPYAARRAATEGEEHTDGEN
jgi:hypothetical protein